MINKGFIQTELIITLVNGHGRSLVHDNEVEVGK